MYRSILLLHILAATIWTGGHLYLAIRVLPAALTNRSASKLIEFEESFERLGFTALAVQILSGFWMATHVLPPRLWFSLDSVASQMIIAKLALLLSTALVAVDARFRLFPRMNDERVRTVAPHIAAVTTFSVLFVAAGVGIRTGGWW